MNRKTFLTSIAAALLAVAPLAQTGAANGPVAVAGTNFTINIVDPDPSNGFSDDTVASDPAPGNPGNTVGEQRLEAYKEAARIWQTVLDVDVPIVVQASFLSLFCDEDSAVLGAAGANQVFRDFPGPSFPLTWYGAALANELSGFDLGGTTPDPGLISPPFNDEIVSFFNSDLGQTGCLENSSWYYGLDHNNPADSIDFLAVLLHEVAHGLGFQNFVNEASGQHLLGHPDQWSRFEADNVLGGKHWNQMLDIERAISATNGPNLVWDGPAVTAEAPNVLGPAQVIVVNAPPSAAGAELPFGTAGFGPSIPAGGLTGDVMLVNDATGTPSDACEAIQNDLTDMIALIDRGGCTFVLKAQNAEAAGAKGVIIANNQPGVTPIGLGGSGAVGILTVSVTLDAGGFLKSLLPGVNVTIGVDTQTNTLAGADATGRLKLYAPNPVEPGSSVSHFDVSASPNLLMEPFVSGDLEPANIGLDLTDELLKDIGWDGNVTCPINSNDVSMVNLLGVPTGVENRSGYYTVVAGKGWLPRNFGRPAAGGCYLQDVFDSCEPLFLANGAGGQYLSCIEQVTQGLREQGNLSNSEAKAIRSVAELIAPILNTL